MGDKKEFDLYRDIKLRTAGDIYIGVVGPVRTGKSTFIKRFMDLLVLPGLDNIYVRQRLQDELPQSGSGKTITTTEPKFIPAEAVTVELPGHATLKFRMADCVGYMVPGAMGHTENGAARMVHTPWQEEALPFEEAAEIGTRKVIKEHSTIAVVVTTDGSIGDLPRENYVAAEERVISELKALGKPFAVILNTVKPSEEMAAAIARDLRERHDVPVLVANCARMNIDIVHQLLECILYQFPASQIRFHFPGFVEGLSNEHWIKATLINNIREWSRSYNCIEDIRHSVSSLTDGRLIAGIAVENMDLGTGDIDIVVEMVPGLFYKVVEELLEEEIRNDYQFFKILKEFSEDKKAYDKLKSAMQQVSLSGYGIVQPKLSEMVLEEPEIFRQGNKYGVRLKAKAPSLHIIQTDITTEVSPIVGTEKQSEDLIKYLLSEFESDPSKIWDTNLFGKSLYEMVTEQMENKLSNVPENIRIKVQRSLQKISDEGKDYFICIVI